MAHNIDMSNGRANMAKNLAADDREAADYLESLARKIDAAR